MTNLRRTLTVVLAAVCGCAFFDSAYCAGATPAVVPLENAHAHNDYLHEHPLFDALDQGFGSVEADIFLVDGQLLVGHTRGALKLDRTLESLYLAPLAKRVHDNGGHVYAKPGRFFLLIDIKDDGRSTYAALRKVLAKFADMLTAIEAGKVRPGAITVVLTGNRPKIDPDDSQVRYAGLDGRVSDANSHAPAHLMPMISDNWSNNGDRVSFRDLREMTIPASGSLSVDGGRNGGIRVKGSERSDVVVRACIQTWGVNDEAAKAAAAGIKISTAGTIKADSPGEENWSVSYELLVPRSTDLNLKAQNGGIGITSVEGQIEFETQNGGVSLMDVAGDVKGRTTNGGVNVALAGNSWKGSGLDVTTTNGGVHLSMPDSYAANVETGTTNGGFHSDIPALSVTTENVKGPTRHQRATRLNTALNGGGAPIRLITTNGGVHISAMSKMNY